MLPWPPAGKDLSFKIKQKMSAECRSGPSGPINTSDVYRREESSEITFELQCEVTFLIRRVRGGNVTSICIYS